jgi:hypothetical protein
MTTEIQIHSTAFLARPNERLPQLKAFTSFLLNDFSLNSQTFLYRAQGQPDLSLLVTVPASQKSSILPLFSSNIARDILICLDPCNHSSYFGILPPILASLTFNLSDIRSISFSGETPLDLIAVAVRIAGPFTSMTRFGFSGYPELRISLPGSRFHSIEALIAALNRIEHRLIDGPMLFEGYNDQEFIGIPILYTALFIVVLAGMCVQVGRLDLILIVFVAISYEFEFLMFVPFLYTLFMESSAESAVIPFLLRQLSIGLRDPSSVQETVIGIAGLSFLPPFTTPLLFRKCGKMILPTAFAACGTETARLWRRFSHYHRE